MRNELPLSSVLPSPPHHVPPSRGRVGEGRGAGEGEGQREGENLPPPQLPLLLLKQVTLKKSLFAAPTASLHARMRCRV